MDILVFVDKLKSGTEKGALRWKALDLMPDNHALKRRLETYSAYDMLIWKQNSFWLSYQNGFVLLLSVYPEYDQEEDYYMLCVLTGPESRIIALNEPAQFQQEMGEFHKTVYDKVHCISDFVQGILDDSSF